MLILWLVFCIIVGFIANERGKSSILYFALSVLLSPLLGVIILLLQAKEPKNNN